MTEQWKVIESFGYEVSNLGRVRSLPRLVRQEGRWGTYERYFEGRVLTPITAGRGYKAVGLGRIARRYIHHLVCEAFHGPRPPGYEVNHKDYNKSNNTADNLEWVTREYNLKHRDSRDRSNL